METHQILECPITTPFALLRLKSASANIEHYSQQVTTSDYSPVCHVQTASLEQVLEQVSSSDWLPPDAEADQADFVDPSLRVGALANPGYSAAAAAAVRDGGMINPGPSEPHSL
jgi:hypothetical protein